MAGAVEPGAPGGFFNMIPMFNKIYILFGICQWLYVKRWEDSTRMKGLSYSVPHNFQGIFSMDAEFWRGKRAI